MFVLAELINNWQKGRVADNWLPAENKNIIDPHTLMITEEATDGPGTLCLCLQILWDSETKEATWLGDNKHKVLIDH